MNKVYVLHENNEWIDPLAEAFEKYNIPWEDWHLGEGQLALDEAPPEGVFYNRMSASSHTRGNHFAPELTFAVLSWLENYDRKIINNAAALSLELSKVAQYAALKREGIRTPRTVAVVGKQQLKRIPETLGFGPYIVKPNRGGKGLGVNLFNTLDEVESFLAVSANDSVDGIWLVQEYIKPPESYIVRCDFVGGEFLYASRVDTSNGFELCPADFCGLDANPNNRETADTSNFSIMNNFFEFDLIESYQHFLANNGIDTAGIEFVTDRNGQVYTYDVNTNTNYNSIAEKAAGVPLTGMDAVAQYLKSELEGIEVYSEDYLMAEKICV